MAEPKDVLLENLKETLKGAQMYLLSGSGTALFLLLLAARGQLAAGAAEQEVKVPFADLSAPTFGAALIALVIYLLSGWMIISLVKHIKRIKNQFLELDGKDPKEVLQAKLLLKAGLTYPSMLTTGRMLPGLTAFLVAMLGTAALAASFYASRGLSTAVVTGLIFSHPYLIVAFWLWLSPINVTSEAPVGFQLFAYLVGLRINDNDSPPLPTRMNIFLRYRSGRPCHGDDVRWINDPYWRDLVLFHEYFHGETGKGLGAGL